MKELSHIDEQGKARMVDIGNKPEQQRTAEATGFIALEPATIELIRQNAVKKGDVLTVAEIAGIQAAKNCSHLIPLCHPINLNHVSVRCELQDTGVQIRSSVSCSGKTGVEMEALTSVSIALLTIYDMCKAVDKNMIIGEIKLLSKTKKNI